MVESAPVDELLKLLEVVRRELGADDSRAEIGGREPTGDRVVVGRLGEGWRVVVTFDAPPPDPTAKKAKLDTLLAPFAELARTPETAAGSAEKQLALDAELDALAERAGARAALVFDEGSPVLWGCSAPRAKGWDIVAMEEAHRLVEAVTDTGADPSAWLARGAPDDATLAALGPDETMARRWTHRARRLHELAPTWTAAEWAEALQIAAAVSHARNECRQGEAPERYVAHEDGWGVFVRGFAQIYMVALIYDGPYSELHAEGPALRALPHIENLTLALPPVEPPPRGAKVIALRR